jgi:hypothetical protein
VISQDFAAPGALLPLAGFASYLRGTLRGTTRPSRVSWALWAAAPMIAFAAEITQGTSLRLSLVTFVLGLGPALILAASFANPGAYWRLGRFDWACAAIACAAIAAWAVTRRGDLALALAIAADLCAALPTIAKSWSHPGSESAGTYIASGAGAGITLLTVRDWQFAACAFSAYVVAVCAVITVLIVLPRTAAVRATVAAFTAAVVPVGAMAWAGLHIAAILLPGEPLVIAPAAVAQPPHASRSVPVTRPERGLATAPQQAPLSPSSQSPAAKPSPSRSRSRSAPPRPSPRPSPTRKPSPSPSSTSPYPSPGPSSTSPYPSPTATAPSPSPTGTPSPTPSATVPPSPTPSPTESYPSPTSPARGGTCMRSWPKLSRPNGCI